MRSGISLIGVVAAIAIGGIMTTLLYRSVVQTNRVVYTIDAMVDMYSEVALFKDRIERDVLGTFVPQDISMPFFRRVMQHKKEDKKPAKKKKPEEDDEKKVIDEIFVIKKGAHRNLSMMTFITTNPLLIFDEMAPRAVRVFYQLVANAENQDRWSLMRYEGTQLDIRKFSQKRRDGSIRGHTILDNIKKLSVRCIIEPRTEENEKNKKPKKDEEEKAERTFEYLSKWNDSIAEEQGILLPLFVEIKGEVVDERKKRSVPFAFMIPIKAQYFSKRFRKPTGLLMQQPQRGQARSGRSLADLTKGLGPSSRGQR